MHKYTFSAVPLGYLLNLHFLTKVLTLIFCSVIYFTYLCNTETNEKY